MQEKKTDSRTSRVPVVYSFSVIVQSSQCPCWQQYNNTVSPAFNTKWAPHKRTCVACVVIIFVFIHKCCFPYKPCSVLKCWCRYSGRYLCKMRNGY